MIRRAAGLLAAAVLLQTHGVAAQFINGGLCEPFPRHVECYASGGHAWIMEIPPHAYWIQQPSTFLYVDPAKCEFHAQLGNGCHMTCQIPSSSDQGRYAHCRPPRR